MWYDTGMEPLKRIIRDKLTVDEIAKYDAIRTLAYKDFPPMKTTAQRCHELNEFTCMEDGYYYYFPSGKGGIPEYQLREIADELERLNTPVREQMAKDLARYDHIFQD